MSDGVPRERGGLEVLPMAECLRLLASTPVGRVAFMESGEPTVLPVNHRVDGDTIVFRTAYGSKLDAASRGRDLAFEADQFDESSRTGWSVLARGPAEIVEDDDEIAQLDALGLEPWADRVPRSHWIRIRINEVTGRRVDRDG